MKNRLRVLRAEKGWSQAELAERLNIARQSVNAIKNGKADPSLPLGMRIARLFGQPVAIRVSKTKVSFQALAHGKSRSPFRRAAVIVE